MPTPTPSRNARITASTLRSLRAASKDWFIRDTMQRGFQIKVPPSGNAVYQVEARLGGTGPIKKFKIAQVQDISLAEAREKAKDALAKIRSGIDPLLEKRRQVHEGKTLRQLIVAYYENRDLKPRTLKDYDYMAARLFRPWLDRRVVDITRHEIRDWYARGNATRTHTEGAYRFLNSLMVFALGLEIIAENPCRLVTNAGMRYRIRKRDTHIEVNDDLGKFLNALVDCEYQRDSERVARDVILLILATGLRSIEARTIKWDQVNFDRKLFIIPDTKNGLDHTVPMTRLTYAIFRYRQRNKTDSDYVFRIKRETKSGCITDFQKTLTNICNRAEISVVTAHDLRRTFATVLNSLNVGYADMKQLMNHKTRDITAGIYIQPDINKLRGILNNVSYRYDNKIPVFDAGQGCSRYADDALAFKIYGHGDITPSPLTDPWEEDEQAQEMSDREFWGD